MRADGLLAMLDRWGRAALPGTVLLFFVLLTLAPLRAPYLSDALPLLPALVVFQFSLATPERLPGPLLLAMGVLLDLLHGGPGAPVGVSALGFVLIRLGGRQPALPGRRAVPVPVFGFAAGARLVSWSGASPRCGPGWPSIRCRH
jgi:hypothetical protein